MNEPFLFGIPLSAAFFYFVVYAFLGWCMETVYCSILERRFVPRGFLFGPLCPIYGVGVLMMICWFKPFMDRPVLFYLVATLCMSSWEYFVGWFLETTTHIKYWDYSMYRFNLKGRICLWVCLMWGLLSYLVLFLIHPRVEGLYLRIPYSALVFLDGILLGVLTADAAATVYQLVRTSQLIGRLQQAGDELRLQFHLGKAEISDRLAGARATLSDYLDDLLPEQLDEAGRTAKERYDELMARAELMSRRFRTVYRDMRTSGPAAEALESVKRQGERVRTLFLRATTQKKSGKKK